MIIHKIKALSLFRKGEWLLFLSTTISFVKIFRYSVNYETNKDYFKLQIL